MSENGKTILVIEDEPMINRLMDRLLTKTGYEVLTAATGPEGIGKFREHISDIELVILDMSLPHMNGAEVLKILRAEKPGIRVLLSSGWVPAEMDALFANNRPNSFLPKPFQTAVLLQKVEELLL